MIPSHMIINKSFQLMRRVRNRTGKTEKNRKVSNFNKNMADVAVYIQRELNLNLTHFGLI